MSSLFYLLNIRKIKWKQKYIYFTFFQYILNIVLMYLACLKQFLLNMIFSLSIKYYQEMVY